MLKKKIKNQINIFTRMKKPEVSSETLRRRRNNNLNMTDIQFKLYLFTTHLEPEISAGIIQIKNNIFSD